MKLKPRYTLKYLLIAIFFITISWILPLPDSDRFSVPGPIMELSKASATMNYGIFGQKAPELNLNTWIDGNGKEMEPVNLKDFRGKVIYLYFFQNW